MTAASIGLILVALLHVWFLVLEMALWERPLGRRLLRMNAEQAAATAVLAKNQGLYNGFLAAGLIWAAVDPSLQQRLGTFFLGCVVVAGIFGGMTASRSIFVLQAAPAAIALVVLWAS